MPNMQVRAGLVYHPLLPIRHLLSCSSALSRLSIPTTNLFCPSLLLSHSHPQRLACPPPSAYRSVFIMRTSPPLLFPVCSF
jgi:hypothetical protein